jgi:hypothetical protein
MHAVALFWGAQPCWIEAKTCLSTTRLTSSALAVLSAADGDQHPAADLFAARARFMSVRGNFEGHSHRELCQESRFPQCNLRLRIRIGRRKWWLHNIGTCHGLQTQHHRKPLADRCPLHRTRLATSRYHHVCRLLVCFYPVSAPHYSYCTETKDNFIAFDQSDRVSPGHTTPEAPRTLVYVLWSTRAVPSAEPREPSPHCESICAPPMPLPNARHVL